MDRRYRLIHLRRDPDFRTQCSRRLTQVDPHTCTKEDQSGIVDGLASVGVYEPSRTHATYEELRASNAHTLQYTAPALTSPHYIHGHSIRARRV